MSDLHERLAALSPKRLALLVMGLRERLASATTPDPVAVVGLGCRFPGADGPAAFWDLLRGGVDAIGPVPADRWDVDAHYDPDPDTPGAMYARDGGFLGRVDGFDPVFFGISPREAAGMDPQQRLLLEVAWEALEHAGLPADRLTGTPTGVFVGIGSDDYGLMQRAGDPAAMDAYTGTGSAFSVAAGRLSFLLGTQGPSLAVDTACSSSLVAVHLAVRSLRSRECDLALAGGVQLMLAPEGSVYLSRTRALSPDGRCKTFDESADGYGRGEGCGVVVLKRLADAVADGDTVLAVIRGSAVNHDGPSSGLTVPNGLAQQALIRSALADAGTEPTEVGYVEAHGTGTPLGDPIEVNALTAALRTGGGDPLHVGSVKTNIGHLESAAGVAGLIKAVLALHHGQIPPHLHFQRPNQHVDWAASPVRVPTEPVPWERGGAPRVAGVSSFGMSGTNAHVVLAEAPEPAPGDPPRRSVHVLPLSAKGEPALRALAERYASLLDSTPDFAAVCAAAGATRAHFTHRLAVVAPDAATAAQRLRAWLSGERHPSTHHGTHAPGTTPKIAALFTGQGSQHPGMARALHAAEPVFRAAFDTCAAHLADHLDRPLLDLLDSPDLDRTEYTQPALFAVEYALAELWRHWGIRPDVLIGHSIGEVAAAVVAGVLPLNHAARLIATRGRLMSELPPGGAMAAIAAPADAVPAELAGEVAVAARNSPVETVVAGREPAITALCERVAADGVKVTRLHVSHAFHSPLMDPVLDAFTAVAEQLDHSAPDRVVISTVTGAVADDTFGTATYWRDHVRSPVLFADAARAAADLGCTAYLEIGPHPVLLAAARQTLDTGARDTGTTWAPTLRRDPSGDQDDIQQALTAVAALYAAGAALDWAAIAPSTPGTTLPTYPFQRERHWSAPAPRTARAGRPPLGRELSSPALTATVYETELDTATLPFLSDHRIYGEVVVPGAHHLVQLSVATDSALTDVQFPQPVLLADGESRTVQTIVGTDEICLVGRSADDPTWTTHATATPGPATPADAAEHPPHERPADIRERCAADESFPEWFHAEGRAQGLDLDTGFRWLHAVWRTDGEALCEMRPARSQDRLPGYPLHPGLVDAAFQVVGATLPTAGQEFTLHVPLGVDRFRLHRAPTGRVWAHARRRGAADGETVTADVWLVDDDGAVVVECTGLRLKRAERTALLRAGRARPGLLHEIRWRPEPRPTQPVTGRWLVYTDTDTGGVGDALAARLRAAGTPVALVRDGADFGPLGTDEWRLDTAAPDQHRALLAALADQPTGVVHLGALDATDADPTAARSVLHLVQALGTLGATPPKLWIGTRGACATAAEPTTPAQTALWGLGTVLELEHPELWGGHLDLDPTTDPAADSEIDALVAEIAGGPTGERVALRGDRRLVARLARSAPAPVQPPPDARPDGAYLITGGLGALGLAVARWLADRGAGALVLLGRRAPSPEAAATIAELRERGVTVTTAAADVADPDALAAVLADTTRTTPLRGVVHAAGVLADGVLMQQPWERFADALRPKVAGGWALHTLTRDLPLDFFVLFSSAASLLGSAGQANYATANAFLDGLAHHRRALGLPATSVNWGPWTEAGMAAATGQADGRWAAQGIGGITPDEGVAVLGEALRRDLAQVGVLPVTWSTYLRRFPPGGVPPLLADLAERTAAPGAGTRLADDLAAAAPGRRLDLLGDYLNDQVTAVLGLPASTRLEPAQKLFELGMDSLMAIELKNALQAQLGAALPSTVLFEHPTIEALAKHIADDVLGLDLTDPEDAPAPAPADRRSELSEAELADLLTKKLDALAQRRRT